MYLATELCPMLPIHPSTKSRLSALTIILNTVITIFIATQTQYTFTVIKKLNVHYVSGETNMLFYENTKRNYKVPIIGERSGRS